jgi:hypothetical protein
MKTKMSSVSELAVHIDELCAGNNISVQWVARSRRAWASRRRRTIRLYPIINQKRYATALHEIGHLLGPRQRGRRIEQEWGAWEFALQDSRVVLTPATYRMIHRSLLSYVSRYKRLKRAYLPPPADPFWAFLSEIAVAAQG